jgi:multidrug efflux system membrane fusion protein
MGEHAVSPARGKRPIGRIVLLVLAVVGLSGWLWSGLGGAQGKGKAGGPRPVAVTTTKARLGDVPVTLTGIGTVTPLKSVTVRSRVDGQLLEVRFKEGQMVAAGDLLARIDPRPFEAQLAQYQGQLAKDSALLSNARLDLKRYQNLVKQDVLAAQTLDTQASLVRQYEGAVRADQGQVDTARLQIEYSRITAPIAGRVGLRQLDPGNMVRTSDQNGLLVITQVSPISVVFTLAEDNLPAVRERLAAGAKLAVAAYDRSMSRELAQGLLATTDNQIDTATGTVRLRAIFDNAQDRLFPNQFVNAVLTLAERKGVVLVPAVSVRRGPQGAFVYLVQDGKTVTARPVTTGLALGTDILVESGLSAGETVVVEGADRLRDGATIMVRDPNGAKAAKP